MAVRKAGAKGASNPYEPRLPGDTRAVVMMAFSSRAFVHDDEAAAPHDPVARRFPPQAAPQSTEIVRLKPASAKNVLDADEVTRPVILFALVAGHIDLQPRRRVE